MAASVSLRSYLLVTTLPKSKRTLILRLPDIDLSHTWNIHELPWEEFHHSSKKKFYYDMVTSLDDDLLAALRPHLADISPEKSESGRKVHQKTALAFLYLLLSLGSPKFPGCMYTLRSTIPIDAGVGSSAYREEARLQMECVNRWAFVFEMCIHGNPSGVDNTCSTQGKGVVFQKPDDQKPSLVKSLWNFPELPLLLVDTKQAKSTAVELGKVQRLEKFQTTLGGDGIGVLWPAVSRNGLDEYEEGWHGD
ncbi:ribosomal protein S5 domain 2-type protein [Colletotrichum navitas]|uniref:Ribosomal protein S5 domain 2-type protein n=1 Tax=Colletotrichum navitas TaxID=681940 RepID=A0AAD8PZH2_9PEZI|nr:ribosomal protein S5 domain 2-type protein [Colletotrichum navitas]KAK1590786.1 ribosomal protein S5 domain 2-type protein [Colletotrichum navitas]